MLKVVSWCNAALFFEGNTIRLRCRIMCVFVYLIVVACGSGDSAVVKYVNGATPPVQAASTYRVAEGFQIELIASEPLIADPVDMEIDEDGNMYVVEMSGYPLDKSHTGKIKLLRDEDGDGEMDVSILFADGLMFPNGILRWKKGFIITDAPYVLYLEDEDGDGTSDRRDTLLTGFSLSNPHVNVNNPIYGLDNWIYLSHFGHIGTSKYQEEFGDLGEEVRFFRGQGERLPRNANGKNVRFKADGSGLEMLSVKGQFGHTFDEWGHHFLTHNQNHIYQEVLGPGYLHRNPSVPITSASENVSDHGNSAEVYQITVNPDRQLLTPVGITTSTSGLTYYTGGLFPAPYGENTTFVAESVSNLVHVDKLSSKGATYTASRIVENSEFLASTDSWARPVNMYVGPDGALYVVDYYRRIIEHPEWMSDEAVEEGGLYDGHDMGRIFRVSPKGTPPASWTRGLNFGRMESADLIVYLSHKNSWWRLNAQRLLVARGDTSIVHLLKKEVETGDSSYGRLHALWTMEGLNSLTLEVIETALGDAEEGVRENAIRIAERYVDESDDLTEKLFRMAGDESSKVRFQLLCTLGSVGSQEAQRIREEILFRDINDEWVQLAALTARSLDPTQLLTAILKRDDRQNAGYMPLIRKLTRVIGSGEDQEKIISLIRKATAIPSSTHENGWQSAVLGGITEGLQGNKSRLTFLNPETDRLIKAFFDHPSKTVRSSALKLMQMVVDGTTPPAIDMALEKAMKNARNKGLPGEFRAQMLEFLTLTNPLPYVSDLKEFIVSTEEPVVQVMALKIFDRIPGDEVSNYILDKWISMTPGVRDEALNTFFSEKSRVSLLVDALKEGTISEAALGWPRRVRLIQYEDEDIRKEARLLLARDNDQEISQRYRKVLELPGDVSKGGEIFRGNCSICHQVRGELGVDYGPDLGTVHNWRPKDILANILDPNLSIAPGFDLWEIEMYNEEVIQGIIINETSSAVELRIAPDKQRTLNRQEIKRIKVLSNISMMPPLGGELDEQQMANLIAYLRNTTK